MRLWILINLLTASVLFSALAFASSGRCELLFESSATNRLSDQWQSETVGGRAVPWRTQILHLWMDDARTAFKDSGRLEIQGSGKRAASQWFSGLVAPSLEHAPLPHESLRDGSFVPVGEIFNFVVTPEGLTLRRTGAALMEDLASKHVLLAKSRDVFVAGEIWRTADGHLHLNNNSGSYLPDAQRLEILRELLRNHGFGETIEIHPYNPVTANIFYVDSTARS